MHQIPKNNSNMSTLKVSTKTNPIYQQLTEGIDGARWGYGIRRIKLNADPKAIEFVRQVPYTFTSSGFKSQDGKWFLCVRMNVEQCSSQKMRPMEAESNMHQLWGEMMLEFAEEYASMHKA